MITEWPDPVTLPGPWVATYSASDGLRVNGERWDALPRGAEWAGRVVYLVSGAPWLALGARYLNREAPLDCLLAPYRGKPDTLRWEVEGGKQAEIRDGDAWALPSNPCDATDELRRIADLLAWEESLQPEAARWKASASGLAAAVARRTLRGRVRQLRPRWRALARAAFHAGPQLAMSGGGPDVVHLDRIAAYLSAMYAPLPVPGSYRSVPEGSPWSKVRRYAGFGLLAVHVSTRSALPPLPVRWVGGTCWPTGRIWGAWPLGWVREAEEAGEVEVERVLDAQLCDVEPWLEPLAQRLARVEDKRLRKMLYTRAYGLFAAQGRWIARLPTIERVVEKGSGKRRRTIATITDEDPTGPEGWAWSFTGKDTWSHQQNPLYRPDLAAALAAHNATAVVRAARVVPAEAVHLAHVDALWVDAEHAPAVEALGGWARKQEAAPLRVLGTGTYVHGTRARAQGVPGGHLPELLAELAAQGRQAVHKLGAAELVRRWTHGGPAVSALARSTPAPLPQRQGQQVAHVPTWDRAAWSAGNWRARGTEGEDLGTLARFLDADPDATTRSRLAWTESQAAMARVNRDAHKLHGEGADWRKAMSLAVRAEHGPGSDDDYSPPIEEES